jgi:HD superfamily phosphohydrolase
MAEGFRVRDPVHNFLQLGEKEAELLGTNLVQRLRGIRQLALASLVYPGALHSRFDHSLGVCHVAGMMAVQLGLPPDEVELVRTAALLHDLGHGPFSHASENMLKRYAKPEAIPERQKKEEWKLMNSCC